MSARANYALAGARLMSAAAELLGGLLSHYRDDGAPALLLRLHSASAPATDVINTKEPKGHHCYMLPMAHYYAGRQLKSPHSIQLRQAAATPLRRFDAMRALSVATVYDYAASDISAIATRPTPNITLSPIFNAGRSFTGRTSHARIAIRAQLDMSRLRRAGPSSIYIIDSAWRGAIFV